MCIQPRNRGNLDEVVLIDIEGERATGHALDIQQSISLENNKSINHGTYNDVADVGVVVVCASTPHPLDLPNSTTLLEQDLPILRGIFSELDSVNVNCPILVATNPVDAVITILHDEFDIPRQRLLGYTLNDLIRFRWTISIHVKTDMTAVDAYVIGEHSPMQVPVFSGVKIHGCDYEFSEEERREITKLATESSRKIVQSKNETTRWTTGRGLSTVAEAIYLDKREPFPCSILAAREYGYESVSFGMPVILGQDGAISTLELELDESEIQALERSVQSIQTTCRNWNQ